MTKTINAAIPVCTFCTDPGACRTCVQPCKMSKRYLVHPGIHRAGLELAMCNGGIHHERSEHRWAQEFNVFLASIEDRVPKNKLDRIDLWLDVLSDENLTLVCDGEEDEASLFAEKNSAPPGTTELLILIFEEVC